MKADYDANPSSPATCGGRFYKYIKATADGAQDTTGLAQAWMYHVTGTASYADAAYNASDIQSWLARGETEPLMCRNTSSDSYALRVLIYDWIYTGLSAGQRSAFLAKLNVTANLCTNALSQQLPTIRDIDQTIGDYFGTAMLHSATTSYNSTINTYWADGSRAIGGFTAEAADFTDRRNAVRAFVETYSAGGDGPASSEYNTYTYAILGLGYWALDVVGESSNFPEIATWLTAAPLAYAHALSPDFKLPHQWGDDEKTNPRGPQAYYRFDSALCFAGLTQSNTAFQDWLLDWIDDRGGFATTANANETASTGANPRLKCAAIWNPYATRGDRTTLATTSESSGAGVYSVRSGWSSSADWFVSTFTQRRTGDTHHGRMWGDFQLWHNAKWALTHPIGYDGPTTDPRGTGTIVYPVGPIASWTTEYGGARKFEVTSDYAYVAGTQGGSVFWDDYYNIPPTVLMEDTRGIVWLRNAGVVVVHSRTNIDDPRPCTTGGWDGNFAAWCAARPSLKQLPIHSPVSPTVNSNTVSWTYATGESVKVTHLLPASVTYTVVTESSEWASGTFQRGFNNASELNYHVAVRPTSDNKWDTFLDVYNIHDGTPMTVSLVQDTTNKVDAAFVTDGSSNYLVAFNAVQGPDVPQPTKINGRGYLTVEPHASQMAAVLDTVALRSSSFTLAYADGSAATLVVATNLSTSVSWSYRVNGGAPVGMSVSSDNVGSFSVAPTGSVTLDIIADDQFPVVVDTGSLPDGVLAGSCAGSLSASGGDGGPYTWSVTAGLLPTGCTLNANGTWSGTYASANDYTFTLQACDSTPACGTREFTVTIADLPVITTSSLDAGVVGSPYSDSCTGSGGATPYVFTVDPDPPCPGIAMNSSCAFSGTPTTAGTCNFDVTLTDDDLLQATKAFALTIAQSLAASFEVWIDEQGYRAVVNYRLPGLPQESSCTVALYDESATGAPPVPVDTQTKASGLSRRWVVFTNLDPGILYRVAVSCAVTGSAESVYFRMPSAPTSGEKTVPIQLTRPAILANASRVTADWDYDGTMSDPTSVQNTSCSTNCTVNLTIPNQNVYYYRWRWQDGSDNVLATSAIQPLVVP